MSRRTLVHGIQGSKVETDTQIGGGVVRDELLAYLQKQEQFKTATTEDKGNATNAVSEITRMLYTLKGLSSDKAGTKETYRTQIGTDKIKNSLKKVGVDFVNFFELAYNKVFSTGPTTPNPGSKPHTEPGSSGVPKVDESKWKIEESAINMSVEGFSKLKSIITVLLIVDSSMDNKQIAIKSTDAILKKICNRAGGDAAPPTGDATDDKDKKTPRSKKHIETLYYLDESAAKSTGSAAVTSAEVALSVATGKEPGYEVKSRKSISDFNKIDLKKPIDLVIRIGNGEKGKQFDLQFLLFMSKLTGDKIPYLINRINDSKYEGDLFQLPSGTSDYIDKVAKIIQKFELVKKPDFKTGQEHDRQVEAIMGELRKMKFIKPESVVFLVDYKYNITATEQQNLAAVQDFKISESILQLSTQVKETKYEKGLKSFITYTTDTSEDKKKKEELWFDMTSIPYNINLLVSTESFDFDLFAGLMKLLEFTKHKLTKLYISKSAYDSEELQALNLKGKFMEVIMFSNGGMYELLSNPLDVNLVADFQRKTANKKRLSQFIINEHIKKLSVDSPGYFELDDNYQLNFRIKYDLTKQTLDDAGFNTVQSIYDTLISNIKSRTSAKEVKDIVEYNASLKTVEEQIKPQVEQLGINNDFMLFQNLYTLQQISSQEQNKNVIDKIKSSIVEKKDSEFYNVISSLKDESNKTSVDKLTALSRLPNNVDVLLLNYNGSKKDFISLVKDVLSGNRVNTLYVQKSDMTEEINNVFSQVSTIQYTNVYEIFQKMAMANRKDLNIDLVINASPIGKLTPSQRVISTAVLSEEDNVYMAINTDNNTNELIVYDSKIKLDIGNTSSETIGQLKTFAKLSQGKKIGSELVEFNEIVDVLSKKNDPDMFFFLDKATAQPVKTEVFTDDLKALTTLLQDKENKQLSDFITMNFDKFRDVLKVLPKDNTVMVTDFTDTFSTFEIAMKTLRVMLKGVERNIVKAFYNNDTIQDRLVEYLNLSGDKTAPFTTFGEIFDKTAQKDKVRLIVKGTVDVSPLFVLYLRILLERGENPIIYMFDFNKHELVVKPADKIAESAQFTSEQLDELYMAFNAADAIQAKILSLNENGLRYLSENNKREKFDREKFIADLTELNGIIQTFKLDDDRKISFTQIVSEYSDALLSIDLTEKINSQDHVMTKLWEITKDYSKLKSYQEAEQNSIKSLINKLYITFSDDKALARPSLLKYRPIINAIQEQDSKLENKDVKQKGTQEYSLDYYITREFIEEARNKYKVGINAILQDKNTLLYQKLVVLKKLFDSIYKVRYGHQDTNAGKDENIRKKFKRFIIPQPSPNSQLQDAYHADVIIEMLRYEAQENATQIAALVDDKERDKTNIVFEVVRMLFSKINKNSKLSNSKFYKVIYDTVQQNVYILINEVSSLWNKNINLPYFNKKNIEENKKYLSHYFFDRHIIPVFIELDHLTLPYGGFGLIACDEKAINGLNLMSRRLIETDKVELLKDDVLVGWITKSMFQKKIDKSIQDKLSKLATEYVKNYGAKIETELDALSIEALDNIKSLRETANNIKEVAKSALKSNDKQIDFENKKLNKLEPNTVEKLKQEVVIPPLEENRKMLIRTLSVMQRMIENMDLTVKYNTEKAKGTTSNEFTTVAQEVAKYNERVLTGKVTDVQPSKKDENTLETPVIEQPSALINPGECKVYGSNIEGFEKWYNELNQMFSKKIFKNKVYNVEQITGHFIDEGLKVVASELVDIVNGHEDKDTKNVEGGFNFMLMDDVFTTLTTMINQLTQVSPSLTNEFNQLLNIAGQIKQTLKNPVIASVYFINRNFQQDILNNQFWLYVLLQINNSKTLSDNIAINERAIDGKVNALLLNYEKICEKIRNAQVFKETQGYITELISLKKETNAETHSGGAIPNVEFGNTMIVPSKTASAVAEIVADADADENAPPTPAILSRRTTSAEDDTEDINIELSKKTTDEVTGNSDRKEFTLIEETSNVLPDPRGNSNSEVSITPTETSNVLPDPTGNSDSEVSITPTETSNSNDTPDAVIPSSNAPSETTSATPAIIVQTHDVPIASKGFTTTHAASYKAKDPTQEELEGLTGTNFYKLLSYIKKGTFKTDLKSLFAADKGKINIKASNIAKLSEKLFQFGGGFFGLGNKTETTQPIKPASGTSVIPEFIKPSSKPDPFKPDLTSYEAIDFDEGVERLFGDDPELVKLIIAYNKKFNDEINDIPDTKTPIDVNTELIKVKSDNTTFTGFVDIKSDMSQEELKKITDFIQKNVRTGLTKMFNDSKYDTTRVSKQIKKQPLQLSSDVTVEKKPILDLSPQEVASDNLEAKPTVGDAQTVSKIETEKAASPEYQAQQTYVQNTMTQGKNTNNNDTPKPQIQSMVDKISTLASNVGFVSVTGGSTSSRLPNLTQTHLYLQEVLTDVDGFYKKMQRKHTRWLDEINSMLNQGEVSLKLQIQSKVSLLGSGKLLEIERRKVSIQLMYLFKKFARAIADKGSVNYGAFKDYFFQDKRREIRAILDYLKQFAYVKDDLFIAKFNDDEKVKQRAQQIRETYLKVESTFNALIKAFHNMNLIYYGTLSEALDSNVQESSTIYMRDKERAQVVLMKRDIIANMESLPNKIKYFYTLNYPITEMFDMQFVIMYIIKLVRIMSYQFSMNMATNVFIQKYENVVYDKKVNPPSLVSFMFIFLGFDLFFNVFILILLGLCGFLFKTENNTFPIDSYLYTKFIFDYVVSTIVIMIIGILIGSVIKQKKYFRYKTEGERGIRAFEEIMKMSATVITLVPLFMIVS
jgi:hypothetical protein